MRRTLRKKFVVTAMIAVTVLLAVVLGAVNGVNAWTGAEEIDRQLELLTQTRHPGLGDGPFQGGRRQERGRVTLGPAAADEMLFTARYYLVRADADGTICEIDTQHIEYGSESEAEELCAAAAGQSEGRIGAYRFRTAEQPDGGTLTVFLYTAQARNSVLRVALLSGLAGAVAWGLMLLLVMFLSKKAIEPIAENMEKQKRFITDAGHELKTPLAIILANTEAMELRQGESKYSRNIREQVRRLSGLTQNLLTLARADEAAALRMETLDLGALAAESLRPFLEGAELKGIRVDSELPEGVTVSADRGQLGQLLSILLDNAVKYTPEGGAIALRLRREGKAVLELRNTVADTATPPERFFDRFYRADEARTQKNGGFGIGLSAARAIAEAHKGSLTAAYEGDQLVFTLTLQGEQHHPKETHP